MQLWLRIRQGNLILPLGTLLLVLNYTLAGRTVVLTRILGVGANVVDVVQFAVAPLATCIYVLCMNGNAHRERCSYGRAQTATLVVWAAWAILAGFGAYAGGVLLDLSSLRVAGISFLGLTGMAAITGRIFTVPFGTVMPIAYFALSLMISAQGVTFDNLWWPLARDVNWSWSWTALALWAGGTASIAMRPTLRQAAQ